MFSRIDSDHEQEEINQPSPTGPPFADKVIPELDITKAGKGPLLIQSKTKVKSGIYFQSIEGWRGSILVALDINTKGQILEAYIRDPSVLNWHALELAVRGELIGDFPLNNKSFNLSYVGFDL